jgi:myb proto-oncogene protein
LDDTSIALTAGRTGKWTEDEDLKLKAAVQTHGGKNWNAIAALVPGRTRLQCNKRWYDAVDPILALTAGSTGTWTEDEDLKLKAAVQTHGGKNWYAIALMVPGRTKNQCHMRWYDTLDPSIALTARRTGTWTAYEDRKLKGAVQTNGVKEWVVIAALVPGRTKNQCYKEMA